MLDVTCVTAGIVQAKFYTEFGNAVPTAEAFAEWYIEELHPAEQAELEVAYHCGGGVFGDTLLVKLNELYSHLR